MIFLGARGQGLVIKAWVGGPATGKVILRYMNDGDEDPADPGLIVSPKAQASGGSAALYDLQWSTIGHWLTEGGDPLAFRLELEAFNVSGQPFGWLSLSQNNAKLPAQHNGTPANGAAAPFGDVSMGKITSGAMIVRDFSVHLE